jgi:outer membrane receptor protein involved in Fe transport
LNGARTAGLAALLRAHWPVLRRRRNWGRKVKKSMNGGRKTLGAALAAAALLGASEAASQEGASALTLDTIEVGAAAETGDGPVQGYRAERTRSGTKTDTPIRDIPQSIAIVPRAVIEDAVGRMQAAFSDLQ